MHLILRSGLVLLAMLPWGRTATSQDTLPFTGKVDLILTPTGPSSPPAYIDSMRLEIVAHDGFPPQTACFAWTSTWPLSRAVVVQIHGRRRCRGPLIDGSYSPVAELLVPVPLTVHLLLPGDSAVFKIVSKNVVMGAYEVVFDRSSNRVVPPPYPIAKIPPETGLVTCSGAAYPADPCVAFVEALPWLAQFARIRQLEYWQERVIPPFHTQYETPDSAAFAREVLVDLRPVPPVLERLLPVCKAFTALYHDTQFGHAVVTITIPHARGYTCAEGDCKQNPR
jgi:hypothetical protein